MWPNCSLLGSVGLSKGAETQLPVTTFTVQRETHSTHDFCRGHHENHREREFVETWRLFGYSWWLAF